MPELSIQQAEALIEANSILCPPIKSGYLGDLPQSVVLYIETAHHLQANQMRDYSKNICNSRSDILIFTTVITRRSGCLQVCLSRLAHRSICNTGKHHCDRYSEITGRTEYFTGNTRAHAPDLFQQIRQQLFQLGNHPY